MIISGIYKQFHGTHYTFIASLDIFMISFNLFEILLAIKYSINTLMVTNGF